MRKTALKTDSATCPAVGIEILLLLATIFGWNLSKVDFKSAFLQTQSNRDVYVVLRASAGRDIGNTGYCYPPLMDSLTQVRNGNN